MTKQEACSASLLRINKGTKNRLIVFRSYLLELNPITGSWCSHACSCRSKVLYGFTLFSSFWSSLCAVAAISSHTLARSFKQASTSLVVKRLCKEEDVGYVDLWDSVVGKEGMYARDGLHLSGKGAAVFAEGLSGAVASGLGKVRYLN